MSALSPQLALRIGLAARTLRIAPAQLMPVLIRALKLPLTDQKLKRLTVAQLHVAGQGVFAAQQAKALDQAILYLQDRAGVDIIDPAIPPVSPYREGDLPGSIRIAVASNEGLSLDGDFGDCVRFLIYQVSRQESRLIDVRGTAGEKGVAKRLVWRTALIQDGQVLLARSIGIRSVAQLVHLDVYPVTDLLPATAPEAIDDLRRVLRNSPPPWLAKIMGLELTGSAVRVPASVSRTARSSVSFA